MENRASCSKQNISDPQVPDNGSAKPSQTWRWWIVVLLLTIGAIVLGMWQYDRLVRVVAEYSGVAYVGEEPIVPEASPKTIELDGKIIRLGKLDSSQLGEQGVACLDSEDHSTANPEDAGVVYCDALYVALGNGIEGTLVPVSVSWHSGKIIASGIRHIYLRRRDSGVDEGSVSFDPDNAAVLSLGIAGENPVFEFSSGASSWGLSFNKAQSFVRSAQLLLRGYDAEADNLGDNANSVNESFGISGTPAVFSNDTRDLHRMHLNLRLEPTWQDSIESLVEDQKLDSLISRTLSDHFARDPVTGIELDVITGSDVVNRIRSGFGVTSLPYVLGSSAVAVRRFIMSTDNGKTALALSGFGQLNQNGRVDGKVSLLASDFAHISRQLLTSIVGNNNLPSQILLELVISQLTDRSGSLRAKIRIKNGEVFLGRIKLGEIPLGR